MAEDKKEKKEPQIFLNEYLGILGLTRAEYLYLTKHLKSESGQKTQSEWKEIINKLK